MTEPSSRDSILAEPRWVTAMVRAEPRVPLAGPYMAYLLLMMLTEAFPDSWNAVAIIVHIAAAAWATWLLRNHWPSWGRPHVLIAVITGTLAAVLWVAGQHGLAAIEVAGRSLGGKLSFGLEPPFLTLTPIAIKNIAAQFPTTATFWTHVTLKITRAITIVPIVEELFWRGFLLRALINWDRFDHIPLGQFAWPAFLGTSLLSVMQHPSNWGVSIACWMMFNGLFYWKKSLSCLMLTHAVTNLALYIYVVLSGDWQFW